MKMFLAQVNDADKLVGKAVRESPETAKPR
jgi:hypothetical protein